MNKELLPTYTSSTDDLSGYFFYDREIKAINMISDLIDQKIIRGQKNSELYSKIQKLFLPK